MSHLINSYDNVTIVFSKKYFSDSFSFFIRKKMKQKNSSCTDVEGLRLPKWIPS